MKGKIFNYFPGGNTASGFHSFYKYIINPEDAARIICIKGGPGTGKSTLMKNIGSFFNEKGYDIEMHHCSSDNNSIDGIVIKSLKVALIDGTAPHVTDPIYPGAVDEVLNLGDQWNEEGFMTSREDIINLTKEIGGYFKSTYKYLAAANLMYEDIENQSTWSMDEYRINMLKRELINKIITGTLPKTGSSRHLFATAFTPLGIKTFIQNLIEDYENVYALYGIPDSKKSEILSSIGASANLNGYDVEYYHHTLVPDKLEHILIPELNTAVVTSNELNKCTFSGTQIYMENYLSRYNRERISESRESFNTLIDKALNLLGSAKKLHDQLETHYVPNMNHGELDEVFKIMVNKISNY